MKNNNKPMNLEDFVYLMLATLAKNTTIITGNNTKTIALPANYKQIIENILCADNGWKEKFSNLININEYFNDHFEWEEKLAETLQEVLRTLNKDYEYDFLSDKLLITFTKGEIDAIISKYQDEELQENMEHFTNLLVDYIYTREYQERYCDYSATATAVNKMYNIRKEILHDQIYYNTMVESFEIYAKQKAKDDKTPIINAKDIINTPKEETNIPEKKHHKLKIKVPNFMQRKR